MIDAGKSAAEGVLRKKFFGIDVKCFNASKAGFETRKRVDLMLCHPDQDGAQPGACRDGATLDRWRPVIQPETSWQLIVNSTGYHAARSGEGTSRLRLSDDLCIGELCSEIGSQQWVLYGTTRFPPSPLILQLPEIRSGKCSADRTQTFDTLIFLERMHALEAL